MTARTQALAMHVLAGLRKGDTISISRESLPGAVLFPGIKYKERKVEMEDVTHGDENDASASVGASAVSGVSAPGTPGTSGSGGHSTPTRRTEERPTTSSPLPPSSPSPLSTIQVHRYLVVTRERFIVLDSGGSGIGSTAIVKSNHHLTEVRAIRIEIPVVVMYGDCVSSPSVLQMC